MCERKKQRIGVLFTKSDFTSQTDDTLPLNRKRRGVPLIYLCSQGSSSSGSSR